ncbi:MAG: alanine racemase [Microthrixaceae bacterium]
MTRPSVAEIDLSAVRHNAAGLRAVSGPARLCAVVKADGYGHGSVPVARAAIDGGADQLAVALVEEALVLRDAGVDAPVLVLSEQPADALAAAARTGLTPTVYTPEGIDAAAAAANDAGLDEPWAVHLKVDTGMHRVGCDPTDAVELARRVLDAGLVLGGTFTHLAVADEPERPETDLQLDRFDAVLAALEAAGIDPGVRHAANSAGLLAHPRSHLDLVRAGIALYGLAPRPGLAGDLDLQPAMSVRSEVTLVKPVAAGEGVSYGLRHVFERDAVVATVPLGYADGVTRSLGLAGGCVLIGGVRRPIRGVVTMDQLVVEVTDGPAVRAGDEVVLLGRQGDDEVTADEWAGRTGTISYEVVCGFGPRLARVHRG